MSLRGIGAQIDSVASTAVTSHTLCTAELDKNFSLFVNCKASLLSCYVRGHDAAPCSVWLYLNLVNSFVDGSGGRSGTIKLRKTLILISLSRCSFTPLKIGKNPFPIENSIEFHWVVLLFYLCALCPVDFLAVKKGNKPYF